ncbi:NUDIX domain-containing protein [Patescibacteria group bacterium]|nr:NUDIX domain-containing protein [Patescibacteria group bacterium]
MHPKKKERFKFVSAVHLFLIRDKEILLLRRFGTGYRDGEYSVVAGHMDGGEKASVAMAREAEEETGVIVNPENLKLAHIMHLRSEEERIYFFFTAKSWNGTPKIMEPDKCDDLKWFSLDNLPDNMVPYIKKAIESYVIGETYSEFGWIKQDLE